MAVFSGKWSVFLQRLQLLVALARAPFLLLALPSIGLAIAWCQTQAASPVSFTDSLLVLLAAVAAQVSVNAFNEYEDFCSGLDQQTRRTAFSGGSGALPAQPHLLPWALWLGCLSLLVVALIGMYFLLQRPEAFWGLLLIGGLGSALILLYTPLLTRYPWLCLVAPGLSFGPLMVAGGVLALGGAVSLPLMLLALVPFFLSNNLLLLNQFPDIEADRLVGRRTLPMLLSQQQALALLLVQWLAPLVLTSLLVIWGVLPGTCLLVWLASPLIVYLWFGCRRAALQMPALLPWLACNVLLALLLPALLLVGWLAEADWLR